MGVMKGAIPIWKRPKSTVAAALIRRKRTLRQTLLSPAAAATKCAARRNTKLLNRLNRIEGQVRGIRGMLEKDAYCVDILVQVAAANAALNSFSRELLAQHIGSCVADDLRAGSDEKLEELLRLLPKLMK